VINSFGRLEPMEALVNQLEINAEKILKEIQETEKVGEPGDDSVPCLDWNVLKFFRPSWKKEHDLSCRRAEEVNRGRARNLRRRLRELKAEANLFGEPLEDDLVSIQEKFGAPPLENWNALKIVINESDDSAQITFKEFSRKLSYVDLGFGVGKVAKPGFDWKTLVFLANGHGIVDTDDAKGRMLTRGTPPRVRFSKLRKRLQLLFERSDNPLLPRKSTNRVCDPYQTAFQIILGVGNNS
jgi:hypothetical protein